MGPYTIALSLFIFGVGCYGTYYLLKSKPVSKETEDKYKDL